MIFTSYTYLLFLAIVFCLHWLFPQSWRKPFLVLASYVFYCSWRIEFGLLLLGVTLFNWSYAKFILSKSQRTSALLLGIAFNLAPLIYFKYSGFLLANAARLSHLIGLSWQSPVLHIILPLGISFFTFQGIAYLFDVAAGEEPLQNLLDFMLFKALWPQLIAGPIIRLEEIRDQITTPRTLDYADLAYGSQRILFGFFKKVVLADNLAPFVDMVFLQNTTPNFLDVVTGVVGFGMQIYFDFSAYSDIAIGSARLFGFIFPENFNWPYVSRSPREFWNRWHMSLSRWIRDYVFMPLTFASRNRPRLGPLWLVIAMALCGLWHGAAWTFVLWGIWHGILLVLNQGPARRLFAPSEDENKPAHPLHIAFSALLTWSLVQAGWLLFRASSLHQAAGMLKSVLTFRGHLRPAIVRENTVLFVFSILMLLTLTQLFRHQIQAISKTRFGQLAGLALRPALYTFIIVAVIIFDQEAKTFVYFQF
ncbi:MAG TPA: MBOAT family O-acyltransferase [Tepidisphaeraceae bacterium]|jgi:D-alanyl-lipoteichoic acid acyltransferase DltB (MBOAT superfamily)|nr:MBOAT family O-acyltransferase [Tepidisphaeraceae bacterium]